MFTQIMKILEEIRDKAKENYSIEHHYNTERFYPKLGKMYMIRNNINNNIEFVERYLYPYAIFGKTKDEALKFINEYQKQRELEKIEIIEVIE